VLAGVLIAGLFFAGACSSPAPAAPTPSRTPTTPAAPGSGAETAPTDLLTVPDVSGMNHQQAQDAMQAAGLYNLREVDGKGLGRALVVDSNWVQTGQSPAAGSRVTPDAVITLTAVKNTDK
jgi:hypothetical protein